jgi:AbrB family looped-hinge helix DNA binding protein
MNIRNRRTKGGVVAAIGKLGQRRQVVIPKAICELLGLNEGDFVEVRAEKGAAIVRPKKLADPEDVLTAEEAKLVRKGESQLRRGQYVSLEQIEHDLDSQVGKGSRKAS